MFLVAVVFQLKARRFHPALFWTVIALTSTAGTTLSDFMNRTAGIGYTGGAIILSTGLAFVFVIWWRSGQTLDVENVATFRGEALFWVAILFSNSLGTSSGDFLADSLGLGFRDSALILSAVMVLLLAGHFVTPPINAMVLFWIAFVLTRPPLGATVGDFLSKPRDHGGLAWGTMWTSATLLGVLMALIAYQVVRVGRRPPLRPLPAPPCTGAPVNLSGPTARSSPKAHDGRLCAPPTPMMSKPDRHASFQRALRRGQAGCRPREETAPTGTPPKVYRGRVPYHTAG